MAIKIPVVVSGELRIAAQLSRKHATCKRHARQNAHLPLLRERKEHFCRSLAKAIENYLDTLHVGELDRFQRLLYSLDTHAVVAQFSRLHEIVQNTEHLRMVIKVCRRAVQLQQIK